jgi:transketolase
MPSRRERANAIRALSMDAVQKSQQRPSRCPYGYGGYRRSTLA